MDILPADYGENVVKNICMQGEYCKYPLQGRALSATLSGYRVQGLLGHRLQGLAAEAGLGLHGDAALVCFLAGPQGGYITGEVISVSGGIGL